MRENRIAAWRTRPCVQRASPSVSVKAARHASGDAFEAKGRPYDRLAWRAWFLLTMMTGVTGVNAVPVCTERADTVRSREFVRGWL